MLTTRLETQGFSTDPGFSLPTLNTDRQQIEDSNLTRISTQVKRFDDFFHSNLGHLSEKSLKHIDYDNLDVLNYVAQNSQSSIYTDDQRGLLVNLRKSSGDSRVSEIRLPQETVVSPRGLVDSHFVSPRGNRDAMKNRGNSVNVTIEPIKNIHMVGKEAKSIKFTSPKKGVEMPLSTRVVSLPNENILTETSKFKPSLFSKTRKNSDSGDLIPILKNNNKRENISITISGGDQTTRTFDRKQTVPSPTNTIFSPTNAEEGKTSHRSKGSKVEFAVDEIVIQSPKIAVADKKLAKSVSLQKNEKEILNVYTRKSSPKAEEVKHKLRSFHQSIGSAEDLQKNKVKLPDAVSPKTQWKKLKGIRKPESYSGGLSSQKVQLPTIKTETGPGSGEIQTIEPTSAKSNLTLGEETEKEKDQKARVMIRNLRIDTTNHTSPRQQQQQQQQSATSKASTKLSLDDKSSTLKSGKNDFNSATPSVSKKPRPQLSLLSGTSSPATETVKSVRIVGQVQTERLKTADHPYKKKMAQTKNLNSAGGESLKKLKSSITEKNDEEEFSQSFSRDFEDRDDSIIARGANVKGKKGVVFHGIDDNEMWPSAIAVEERADPEDDLNLFEKKKISLNLNFHKKKNLIKHNKGAASPKTFPAEAFFAREMQSNYLEEGFVRDFGEKIKSITKNIMVLGSRAQEQLTSISKISFPIGTRKLSEAVNMSQFDYLLKQETVEEKEGQGQRSPFGDIDRILKLGTLETQGTLTMERQGTYPMERQGSGSGSNNEILPGAGEAGSQTAVEKDAQSSWTKSKTHTIKNWTITVNINPPIEEASPQMEESVLPYASLISPGDMSEIMTERRRDQLLGGTEEGSMSSITKSTKQYKFEMSTRKPIEETSEEENPFSEHYESDPHVGNEQLSFRKTTENIFKFNDVDLGLVDTFGSRDFVQRIKANFFGFVEGIMSNPIAKKEHIHDLEASYFENVKRSVINTLQKLFKFSPKTKDAVFSFIDQAIMIPQQIVLSSIAEEEALSASLDVDDSRYEFPLKVKGSMKVPIYELQPNSNMYNRITGMSSITVLCRMDANMIRQAQSIQPFMQMYLCNSTPSLANMEGHYPLINRIFNNTSDRNWEFVSKIIHGLYGDILYGPLESKIELLESNSSFMKFKGDKTEDEEVVKGYYCCIIIKIGKVRKTSKEAYDCSSERSG